MAKYILNFPGIKQNNHKYKIHKSMPTIIFLLFYSTEIHD